MGNRDERWVRVAEAIESRMRELNLTKAELSRRAGVSDTALAGYLAGQKIVRADKRRGLLAALGWTADSFDRILVGHDPVEADDGETTIADSKINEMFERIDGHEERLGAVEDKLDALEETMAAIKELVAQLPAPTIERPR